MFNGKDKLIFGQMRSL